MVYVDDAAVSTDRIWSVLPGDLTGDGQVTLADLRLLVQMLLGQAPLELVLTGQGSPSTEAKTLAAPPDQLTLADGRELIRMLTSQ